MRPLHTFAILVAISFPAEAISPVNLSLGLENLVLCVPQDSSSPAIDAILKGREFSKDPKNSNFYIPTSPTTAFDLNVRFVGLAGVMLQPGPNLTVAASLQELRKNAEAGMIGHKFKCNENGCWFRVSRDNAVLIYPYQADKSLTTIQCGYFGE